MAADAKAQTHLKDFPSIFSLDGKVAVVTGGSRGLGLHAASGFDFPRFFSRLRPVIEPRSPHARPRAKYSS